MGNSKNLISAIFAKPVRSNFCFTDRKDANITNVDQSFSTHPYVFTYYNGPMDKRRARALGCMDGRELRGKQAAWHQKVTEKVFNTDKDQHIDASTILDILQSFESCTYSWHC